VLDLVHPSLFCYVNRQSRISSRAGRAWEEWIGDGEPEASPQPQPKPLEGQRGTAFSFRGVRKNQWISTQYQWLPSEVSVTPEGVARFDSYINNLHPKQHPELYETLGSLVSRFIPMWEKVIPSTLTLTPTTHTHYSIQLTLCRPCEMARSSRLQRTRESRDFE
jgi:hypothetical protein